MHKKFPIFLQLLMIWLLHFLQLNGQDLQQNRGTLIVSYQTDHQGHKLDRIHFWLINEKMERTLYPKKDEFVAHSHTGMDRTVVIT